MNLETNPCAALFAPSWDQSCLGMAAMHSHGVRMQHVATTYTCNAWPRRAAAMHRCNVTMMQGTATMHSYSA